MSDATFDPTLAAAKDRVRRLLGDTDTTQPLLADATIQGAIDYYGEVGATVFLAEGLAAEYGQLPVTTTADGTTLNFAERVKTWQTLADTLRQHPTVIRTGQGETFGVSRAKRTDVNLDDYSRAPVYIGGTRGWWWRR